MLGRRTHKQPQQRKSKWKGSCQGRLANMKLRPTQFGVRENTASPRQHAPRRVVSPPILQSDPLFGNEQQDEDAQEQAPPMKETFELSLTEPEQGSTGGGDSGTTAPGLVGDGKRSAV